MGGGYYGEEMYTRKFLLHLKFGFETGCTEPLLSRLLPYSHKGGARSSVAERNLISTEPKMVEGEAHTATFPGHFNIKWLQTNLRRKENKKRSFNVSSYFPPFGSVPPIRKSQFLLNKRNKYVNFPTQWSVRLAKQGVWARAGAEYNENSHTKPVQRIHIYIYKKNTLIPCFF